MVFIASAFLYHSRYNLLVLFLCKYILEFLVSISLAFLQLHKKAHTNFLLLNLKQNVVIFFNVNFYSEIGFGKIC